MRVCRRIESQTSLLGTLHLFAFEGKLGGRESGLVLFCHWTMRTRCRATRLGSTQGPSLIVTCDVTRITWEMGLWGRAVGDCLDYIS